MMSPSNMINLTEEQKAQTAVYRQKWIDNSLSTTPMTAEDRAIMVTAINGIYKSQDKALPKRILFVPSIFCLRFAGGFAAGLIHLIEKYNVKPTWPDTNKLRGFPKLVAQIVEAAVKGPEMSVFEPGEIVFTPRSHNITLADVEKLAHSYTSNKEYQNFLFKCSEWSFRLWHGGNQWSSWAAPTDFYVEVVKGDISNADAWPHWKAATIHGGPRIMHADFVLVSDRPTKLTVDDRLRPHGIDGPYCQWSDGTCLHAWNGVPVPRWIIEQNDQRIVDYRKLTPAEIDAENNAEVRRVMIERYGAANYIRDAGCVKVHEDKYGILWNKPKHEWSCVEVINGTAEPDGSFRHYFLQVPPTTRTAVEAVAWTYGMDVKEYTNLQVRT